MLESRAWSVDNHDTKPVTFSGITNYGRIWRCWKVGLEVQINMTPSLLPSVVLLVMAEFGGRVPISLGAWIHTTPSLSPSVTNYGRVWREGAERAWSVDQHSTEAVNNDIVVTDLMTVIVTSWFEHGSCSGCLVTFPNISSDLPLVLGVLHFSV